MSALAVVAGVTVGSGALERARARITDRKVARFIDEHAAAPVLAALELADAAPVAAPTAIYTVSAYEPGVPFLEQYRDVPAADRMARFRKGMPPLEVLRRMSNSPLCHAAVAAGVAGPSAHVVGRAGALGAVLAVVTHELGRGAAAEAMIVAFDSVEAVDERSVAMPRSRAAALRVRPAGAATGDGPVVRVVRQPEPVGPESEPTDLVESIVAAVGSGARERFAAGRWCIEVGPARP